ncbi:MAG: hypothetical protein QM769_12610 [Pseudoxanthomonas sp.]
MSFDQREHLAAAWFRCIDALQQLKCPEEALAEADALLAHFLADPEPRDEADSDALQVATWRTRALCLRADQQLAIGDWRAALDSLKEAGAGQADTTFTPLREWRLAAGLREAQLQARQNDAFAKVDAARRCGELAARYGNDDCAPIRARAAKAQLLQASLLEQLDHDREALDLLARLHASHRHSETPALIEAAADALHQRARLLAAHDRINEARECLDCLLAEFGASRDVGIRQTLALARMDGLRWQPAVDAAARIADCDALLHEHAGDTHPLIRSITLDAAKLKARALRETDDATAADALGDAQWRQRDPDDAPQVNRVLLANRLEQIAAWDEPERIRPAAREVQAFAESLDDAGVQDSLAHAARLEALAAYAAGDDEATLEALYEQRRRSGSSRSNEARFELASGERLRMRSLLRLGREEEAKAGLDRLVEGISATDAQPLRRISANAMNEVAAHEASACPPPVIPDDSGQTPKTPATNAALQRYADAVAALARRHGDDPDPEIGGIVSQALYELAVRQRKWNHLDAAAQTYREAIAGYGQNPAPAIEATLASCHLNLGYLLLILQDRPAEALEVYDALFQRFGNATNPEMRDTLSKAASSRLKCLNHLQRQQGDVDYGTQYEQLPLDVRDALLATLDRGRAAADQGAHDQSLACYDEVLDAHRESLHPELRRLCVDALVNKGYSLSQSLRREQALVAYDEAITRYGHDLSMETEENVALAMSNKASVLDALERHDEEIAVYDAIISRWSESDVSNLRRRVANAMFAKAVTVAETDSEAALQLYGEVIDHYLAAPEAAVRLRAAQAAVNAALKLRSLGRMRDAIATCDRFLDACADDESPDIAAQVTKARIAIARSLDASSERARKLQAYRDLLTLPLGKLSDQQRRDLLDEFTRLHPPPRERLSVMFAMIRQRWRRT